MRKLIVSACVSGLCCLLQGQSFQQNRNNDQMLAVPISDYRTEIVVPSFGGYDVMKADLHIHTNYSDGQATPRYRVLEAWRDGMDVIAITDHIEYRPNEKYMAQYVYADENEHNGDKFNVKCDLNTSVREAQKYGKYHDIMVISGIEITRNPKEIGHFNALFTTDNNRIPDRDPLQAIRNAKAQGALVQSNHPGWMRSDNNFTDVAAQALSEGLIDGVEVFNTGEFYPNVIGRARELGLYICGTTDLHYNTYDRHLKYGVFRNMTLLLVKDKSMDAVREAIQSRRTIAYGFGHLAASEDLLVDMFNACVSIEPFYTNSKGRKYVKITNKSSFAFELNMPGSNNDIIVPGMSSVVYIASDQTLNVVVSNMWYDADKHPVIVKSL